LAAIPLNGALTEEVNDPADVLIELVLPFANLMDPGTDPPSEFAWMARPSPLPAVVPVTVSAGEL